LSIQKVFIDVTYIKMGGAPSMIFPNPPVWQGGAEVLDDIGFFKQNRLEAIVSMGDKGPKKALREALGIMYLLV
jgi:hypothetical protein